MHAVSTALSPAPLPYARPSTPSAAWSNPLLLRSLIPVASKPLHPRPDPLQKLLDSIGSEADIRALLIGGTVASHLRHLNQQRSQSSPAQH